MLLSCPECWLHAASLLQGVVDPVNLSRLFALLLCPTVNWIFIFGLGWGLDGAALAVDFLQVGHTATECTC